MYRRCTVVASRKRISDELSTFCKALAHPIRVEIVKILLKKSACGCGDLVEQLPVAQSTVSQHLKVLKECGLVVGEVDGPRRCYGLDRAAFERFKILVDKL